MTAPTRDEVIQMAREAGFTPQRGEYVFTEMLERFAALIAAAAHAKGQEDMRERCAPELLKALKYMLEVCPAINNQGEEAHCKARAAITKATGDQP